MKIVDVRTVSSFAFLSCLLISLTPAAAQTVVVPVTGVTPPLTSVVVDNAPGDQTDPHVSGDWASYTSDISIRYYQFSTGVDLQIPMGASVDDLLSDISGSKIAFTRFFPDRNAVMVFDAATGAAPIEIDPLAGSNRLGSAIGGNTVAYVDFGLQASGEMVVHDLVAGTSVRLTNDVAIDQNPAVSPDGSTVVWEHCATSPDNCVSGRQ